jgi:hypothetical protein
MRAASWDVVGDRLGFRLIVVYSAGRDGWWDARVCGAMVQRVDYYALLSRAVESLERDAYAARGAVYDREHKALLKRLISSNAPCTTADIAREEQAFRDAVRQIEFPDQGVQAARDPPQREPAEGTWPSSSREKARSLRREAPGEPENDPGRAAPPEAKRPSFVRLAARYMLIAAVVVGVGGLGYAYLIDAINLSWLTLWSGQAAAPPSQRAILQAVLKSGQTGNPIEGKAVWRTRTVPNGPSGKPDMVVTVEVEIPEQHVALAMSLSREADASAGMSHLLELRFALPDQLPFGGISRVANIAMKGSQTEPGQSLVGTSINIAPGQFMFGLLGVPDVVQQNVQRLRTQNWFDLALIFANGAPYTLSVEKGASGEQALNEALAQWGE